VDEAAVLEPWWTVLADRLQPPSGAPARAKNPGVNVMISFFGHFGRFGEKMTISKKKCFMQKQAVKNTIFWQKYSINNTRH
jgi:hypothetical protein